MAEYGRDEQRQHQKEQNQAANSSTVSSLVRTYLGIQTSSLAMATLSNRTRVGKLLHNNINRFSRFAQNMNRYTSSKALEDWNIHDVRRLRMAAPTQWNEAKDYAKNLTNTIDLSDDQTLFHSLYQAAKGYGDGFRREAEKRWGQEVVLPKVLGEVTKIHKDRIDAPAFSKAEQFVKAVLANAKESEVELDRLKHKYFNKNNYAEMNFADDLILNAKKYKTPSKEDNEELWRLKKDMIDRFQKEAEMAAGKVTDPMMMAKKFGQKNDPVSKLVRKITGDQAVTMEDVVKNADKLTIKNGRAVKRENYGNDYFETELDLLDELKKFDEKLAEKASKSKEDFEKYRTWQNLVPDKTLRKTPDGTFYSTRGANDIYDKMLAVGADTLPGKILKLRGIQYSRFTPNVLSIVRDSFDPVLAAATNDKNVNTGNRLQNHLYYIYGDIYKTTDEGLKLMGDVSQKYHFISGRYGNPKHLISQLSGELRYKKSNSRFKNIFDIGQDRDQFNPINPMETLSNLTRKYNPDDDTYIINRIRHLSNTEETGSYLERKVQRILNSEIGPEELRMFTKDLDEYSKTGKVKGGLKSLRDRSIIEDEFNVHDFMSEHIKSIDRDTAIKIYENMPAGMGDREMAHALSTGSLEDMVGYYFKKINNYLSPLEDGDKHKTLNYALDETVDNPVIKRMLSDLYNNAASAKRRIYRQEDRLEYHIGSSLSDLVDNSTKDRVNSFEETFRTEMSKDLVGSFLQDNGRTVNYYSGYEEVQKFFEQAGIKGHSKNNLDLILGSKYFESKTGIGVLKRTESIEASIAEQYSDFFLNTMQNDEGYGTTFKDTLHNLTREAASWTDKTYEAPEDIAGVGQLNEWITLRNNTGVMDILSSLNDATKAKAATKHFFKQWVAGRDNLEDVSANTLIPYFFLSRLSDEVNKVGLGFSKDNLGSTYDLGKAILLKRILPVAVGLNYLEWTDDATEAATGRSISGAMAGGVAEFDIASRRVLDTLGVTDWLKEEKKINPIMQYWGEHDDFMSADERREWYESGYDPVRKGAWWTFGGVNEARGSEIQYFTPTWVRRIQSDYKDKALYDGFSDKWSHSLLPTPSNPLSPIMGLLDPYWLEERHKEDRPYLLTGHMFNDGTPWGAVLNSTIGDIIKPQKDLHTFLGFEYRNINGIDPKSMLHAMNQEIKQWARDVGHRNYIQLNGDTFTPINITEYDAPTQDSKTASLQFKNGQIVRSSQNSYGVYTLGNVLAESTGMALAGLSGVKLLDALESVNDNHNTSLASAVDYNLFGGMYPVQNNVILPDANGQATIYDTTGAPPQNMSRSLYTEDRLKIELATEGDILGLRNAAITVLEKYNPVKAMRQLNEGVKSTSSGKSKAVSPFEFDEEEGIISADKLKNYRPSDAMELLNDPDTVTQLIHTGKGNDMVQEAAVSWRLISGIYGYMLGSQTGFGVDDRKRIATGADITSGSRDFWDEGWGGLGGATMEIARRFIPDYRRNARINPLMNTMPDWMPDRFRYGDPYTAVIRGEMRLPGKGYESLNELHPDAYGRYGAFDRMKILADIAPFSPEYRLWRDIAKKTVTDPALIDQMSDIKQRVNQQGKKHDFYDYKVVGHGIEYKEVVVSELLDYGKFRSGNSIFKIAGASIKGNQDESMKDVLARYIRPGDRITVAVDSDEYSRTNNDSVGSIEASVFRDGENVGENMINNGDASIRKGSTSAAALASYGPLQRGLAYGSELIAHMDIPWLSDQFLRVRSPLESYEAEQVYGTPYQSWETPFQSFVEPAFIRAAHDRSAFTGLLGAFDRYVTNKSGTTKNQRHLAHALWLFGDRGAFMGAAISIPLDLKSGQAMTLARHGSALTTAAHFITGGNGMFDEVTSGANLGQEVARFFGKNRIIGAAAGAIVGAGYRIAFGDKNDWIPDRVKKKWEMEDYFDRLTYLKYQGLFRLAAEKAEDEEDVDLEQLLAVREKRAEQTRLATGYFKRLKKKLLKSIPESDGRDELTSMLTKRINALSSDPVILQGGKWTRTALLYKQVADSTMYGLKDNATWSQIITALPTNDREYFMEFVKERNPDKREEILNKVSPFLKRALQMAWGKKSDIEEPEDNKDYFKKYQLPKADWAGWAPQVDLKDVEVKTIANEAMSLADFGFYSNQTEDPNVINAPNLQRTEKTKDLEEKLTSVLKGQGLKDVDISIMPGPAGGGTSIIASIKTMLGIRQQQKQIDESLSMQSV